VSCEFISGTSPAVVSEPAVSAAFDSVEVSLGCLDLPLSAQQHKLEPISSTARKQTARSHTQNAIVSLPTDGLNAFETYT